MIFAYYSGFGAVLQGGEPIPEMGRQYPAATDTPPPGAPSGYPAPRATDPLDQWLPTPRSAMRYGGLFANCDWQGHLYDTCSKTPSQAHSSRANVKWDWLLWRKAQVGEAAMTEKERAFFSADAGRTVPGGFVDQIAKAVPALAIVGGAAALLGPGAAALVGGALPGTQPSSPPQVQPSYPTVTPTYPQQPPAQASMGLALPLAVVGGLGLVALLIFTAGPRRGRRR